MSRRVMLGLALIAAVAVAAVAVAVAAYTRGRERTAPAPADRTTSAATTAEVEPPETAPSTPRQLFTPYEPPSEERYVNGKRLAGRVAQRLTTFEAGATAEEIAAGAAPGTRAEELERVVAPLVDPAVRSSGEVVYVQLSGVTATTLGAMVLVRQHLEEATGTRRLVVRVMDIRLRRTNGPWSLDQVVSVGGTPVARPANLSPAAIRVLDHPNIELADTARWDIYRGGIDDGLLRALADAADRWRLAVSVLRTGHPLNVWATKRRSAHTAGRAADIYAVDGALVLRQRVRGGEARRLAAAFLVAGAAQVGSPWNLPPGGRRSFSDVVHQDHIHLQQTRSSRPPAEATRG